MEIEGVSLNSELAFPCYSLTWLDRQKTLDPNAAQQHLCLDPLRLKIEIKVFKSKLR